MSDIKNVNGHYYPPFHRGWGGFAEELFHYTSRYYLATEAFLRNLSQQRDFAMSGYKAALLSGRQRDLMAAVLSCEPEARSAMAAVSVVCAVIRREAGVDEQWVEVFRDRLSNVLRDQHLVEHGHLALSSETQVSPLDPFLNLAERLQMPVAVRDHHVEVCLHSLARHLDSPASALRSNLQNAVLQLHNAGYMLRNHPHLTHTEAREISDEDAV